VRIALVTAGLALFAPSGTPGQSFRQKDFDAYVARGLQVLRTPGASIAVVKDGRVLFAKGYGVRPRSRFWSKRGSSLGTIR